MKKLVFGSVALVALGAAGSALAADMRVKAPPPAPVAAWTGVYVGVNGGYGWARSDTTLAGTNAFCNPILGGCGANFVAGQVLAADVLSAQAVPGVLNPHARGGLVGGTFGFNQQFGYWVAGVETDLAWASIRGSDFRGSGPVVLNPLAPAGTALTSFNGSATASTRLSDFGTLRGRLGFTPVAPLLVYATGGLAYGRVTSDAAVTEVTVGPCGLNLAAGAVGGCPFTPAAFNSSSTRAGWTVGGGAEYLIFGQWSLKAEYLYFDLGGSRGPNLAPLASLGNCAAAPAAPVPCPFTTVNVISSSSDFRGSIVRVGLNYKFGAVAAPY
jgi:outer membrane immunogenic protein